MKYSARHTDREAIYTAELARTTAGYRITVYNSAGGHLVEYINGYTYHQTLEDFKTRGYRISAPLTAPWGRQKAVAAAV